MGPLEHDLHNLRLGSGGACGPDGAYDPVMELSWQQRDSRSQDSHGLEALN